MLTLENNGVNAPDSMDAEAIVKQQNVSASPVTEAAGQQESTQADKQMDKQQVTNANHDNAENSTDDNEDENAENNE